MIELADIFRRAGAAFRGAFQGRMLPAHPPAKWDIVLCRTPALGGSIYACDTCDAVDYSYHSCRNRHCPKCQEDRAQSWLEKLRSRLLPCDHYLLTFTLPAELRTLARSHQRLVYGILLREAAAAVQTLAADPQWVGGRVAILAVLHTWSRNLAYHPHVHLLVTAGGLSPDGTAWVKPANPRFLFPGYVISPIFRAKVKDALTRARLIQETDPNLWNENKPWVANVKQIGNGQRAALYLSRYVYRVALSNHRIERFEHDQVTFRYTHAPTHQTRRMTLPVQHFIARFLQHVLPRGFTKIRYYGLLSSVSRKDLDRARLLLEFAASQIPPPPVEATGQECSPTKESTPPPPRLCPVCKRGHLHLQSTIPRPRAPP
jgi:hypothetical protein